MRRLEEAHQHRAGGTTGNYDPFVVGAPVTLYALSPTVPAVLNAPTQDDSFGKLNWAVTTGIPIRYAAST